MSIAQVILVSVIGLIMVNAAGKQKSNLTCEEPTAHYVELGCRAIYTKKSGNCPEKYDCPFITGGPDPKKCYYKMKEYNLGESLGEVIDHACLADCVCTRGFDDVASLSCAQVECPNEFFSDDEPNQCVKQHKMKRCCSFNEICDPDAVKALKTCEWDGRVYREGEKIYPTGTCKQCICSKEFDGSLESLPCSKTNCGIEIHNSMALRNKCAPIFFESRLCCPIEWKCPEDDDVIDETLSRKSFDPDMKCHFGDKVLNVGDRLAIDDECLSCSCNIPPMMTCIRSIAC